jgi:hypothetical protein
VYYRIKEKVMLIPVVLIVGVAISAEEVPSEKLLRAIESSPFKNKVIP